MKPKCPTKIQYMVEERTSWQGIMSTLDFRIMKSSRLISQHCLSGKKLISTTSSQTPPKLKKTRKLSRLRDTFKKFFNLLARSRILNKNFKLQ